MKMKLTILLILFIFCNSYGQSQEVEKIIQSGNEFYKKQQYEHAASEYSKAIGTDSSNTTALFNLGNSLYKKNSRDEAIKTYSDLATKTKETGLRSNSYYNTGVVLGKQQKLEESIEAYKNALRQNPDNTEARENLQKALLELKKKNPPPKKEKEKKQQKQQQQPKMSQKEAEQRLKLMEQKEKQVQQRLQKEKSKTGGGQAKDW
jgi:Ca-activated chloride channel family protein